jgi:DNA-binding MarR family transcriptional regulator
MAANSKNAGPLTRPATNGNGNGQAGEMYRLLRYSHIFSSAVREMLESKVLQQVSQEPLSISQFHLLKLMMLNGQHQVGQVADFLGVSPPAATKNIDKLEGLGLLVRTPDKGDRRATLLSVTPKGRRLVKKFEEKKAERLEPVVQGFDKEEIDEFSRMLERFSVSLLDLDPSNEGACLRCSAYLEAHCPVGRARGGCPYQENKTKDGNG